MRYGLIVFAFFCFQLLTAQTGQPFVEESKIVSVDYDGVGLSDVNTANIGMNRIYYVYRRANQYYNPYGFTSLHFVVADTLGNLLYEDIFSSYEMNAPASIVCNSNGDVYILTLEKTIQSTDGSTGLGSTNSLYIFKYNSATINNNLPGYNYAGTIPVSCYQWPIPIRGMCDNGRLYVGLSYLNALCAATNGTSNQANNSIFLAVLDENSISQNIPYPQNCIYSTFLGGNGNDYLRAMYVENNTLYISGYSYSSYFPYTSGSTNLPGAHFFGRISNTTMLNNGFINPANGDYLKAFDGIYLNSDIVRTGGKIYLAGQGTGIPTTGGGLTTGGCLIAISDATMNANSAALIPANGDYMDFYGGTDIQYGNVEEHNGDIYILGTTSSANLLGSTNNYGGISNQGFIRKVVSNSILTNTPSSSAQNWLTYLPAQLSANSSYNRFQLLADNGGIYFSSDRNTTEYPQNPAVPYSAGTSPVYHLCPDGFLDFTFSSGKLGVYATHEIGKLGGALYFGRIGYNINGYDLPTTAPNNYNIVFSENNPYKVLLSYSRIKTTSLNYSFNDVVTPDTQIVCQNSLPLVLDGSPLVDTTNVPDLLYYNIQNPLNAPVVVNQFQGTSFFQWQASNSAMGPWENLAGATLEDYLPVVGSVDKYYRRIAYNFSCGDTNIISTSNVSAVLVNNLIAPQVDAGGVFNTCPNVPVIIGGSPSASGGLPPYTYQWDFGLQSVSNPSAQFPDDALITLTVTDANNCVSADQAQINVISAEAGPNLSLCEGQGGVLLGTSPQGISGISYAWSPTNGLSCANCATPTANPGSVTSYFVDLTVNVTGGGTCQTSDNVVVTPIAAPQTTNFAGNDFTTCFGGSIPIGTPSETGYTYSWVPGNYQGQNTFYGTTVTPSWLSQANFNMISYPQANPQVFYLRAKKQNCTFVDDLIVTLVIADAGADQCGPATVGIPDGTPALNETYSWSVLSGPGVITGPTNTPTTTVSASVGGPTTYLLTVSLNGIQCTDTVVISDCGVGGACTFFEVLVDSDVGCPSTNLTSNPIFLTADVAAQSGLQFAWTPQTGLSNYNTQTVELLTNTPTTYSVTLTDPALPGWSCTAEIAVNGNWNLPPLTVVDTTICVAESIVLVTDFDPLLYYNNGNNINIVPNPTITDYPVIAEDSVGCISQDTAIVQMVVVDAYAGGDWYVCANALVELGGVTMNPGVLYSWSPPFSPWQNGTSQFSFNPELLITNSSDFILEVEDPVSGCTDTDTVGVIVENNPIMPGLSNVTICAGSGTPIGDPAINGASYSWSPAAGLSCTNCAQPVATPNSTTTYTRTVTLAGNCGSSAVNQVTVNVNSNSFTLNDMTYCSSTSPISLAGANAPAAQMNYNWFSPYSNIITNANTATPNVIPWVSMNNVIYLTALNSNGCSFTDSMYLTPLSPPVDAGPDIQMCLSDGSVTLGNVNNIGQISWTPASGLSNPNSGTTIFTPIAAGTYTFTIQRTDIGTGCMLDDDVEIEVIDVEFPMTIVNDVCTGGCVQFDLQPQPGVNYVWSPANGLNDPFLSNPTVCPTQSSTYTVVGTHTLGCQNSETVSVILSDSLAPEVQIPTVFGCLGDTGISFSPVITPTGPNYSYSWSYSSQNLSLSSNTVPNPEIYYWLSGTYQFQLEVINLLSGCSSQGSGTFIALNCNNPCSNVVPVNAGSDLVICNPGTSITLNATGGVAYIWNNNVINNVAFTPPLGITTYAVTAFDASGCENSDSVVVSVFQSTPVSGGLDQEICAGDSIMLQATGSQNYTWDSGVLDGVYFLPPVGTNQFVVTAIDSNGCASSDTVLVVVPLPTIYAGADQSVCAGDSVLLFGTGGTSYTWNNNVVDSVYFNQGVGELDYVVTGTDNNGCQVADTVIVTVNPIPAILASGDTTICEGGSATITAIGGTTYAWDNGLGAGSSQTVSPTATTTYTVTGTTNGCSSTDLLTVTVNPIPVILANGDFTICVGDSVTMTATGGTTYTWDNGLGAGSSQTVSPTATTTYTVTGTTNGCSSTDQVTVTVNPIPAILASGDTTICEGSSATITAVGGTTYVWDNGLGAGSSQTVSPTVTTTYTVTGTTNGCSSTDLLTVTVNPIPVILANGDFTICVGDSVTMTATGGTTYVWDNGLGAGSSQTVSPTVTTTYTVTGTSNGCSSIHQITVTVNSIPVILASGDTTICEGGSATITAVGGTTYAWDNGLGAGSSQTVSPMTTTTYTVTGTTVGCSSTDQVTVTVNPIPVILANGDFTICVGDSVTMTATGGTTYTWDNGLGAGSSQTVSPMTTTTYTVTGTTNGCSSTDQVTVTVNPLPIVTMGPFIPSIVCLQDGDFPLPAGTPIGGNYTGTGVNVMNFSPMIAGIGTHIITYTYVDGNSCENTAMQQIEVEDCASLEELAALGYKVYPNPSTDILIIERIEKFNPIKIFIHDTNGKLVFVQILNNNQLKIDVSEWSSGAYFLELNDGEDLIRQKLIIE